MIYSISIKRCFSMDILKIILTVGLATALCVAHADLNLSFPLI